jgi:hypothetical protein
MVPPGPTTGRGYFRVSKIDIIGLTDQYPYKACISSRYTYPCRVSEMADDPGLEGAAIDNTALRSFPVNVPLIAIGRSSSVE